MDAFENLMGMLLRRAGYWTATSVKVEIDKAQKKAIGRPSSPRWEVDLVAYQGATNEILAVECKSFLDSTGVLFRHGAFEPPERYKLFTEPELREVVLATLAKQMSSSGACAPNPTVTLCLATGKIASTTDRKALQAHFDSKKWRLFDDAQIREMLLKAVDAGYENEVALVVAKILMRGEGQ
jgi:hypothetical protein